MTKAHPHHIIESGSTKVTKEAQMNQYNTKNPIRFFLKKHPECTAALLFAFIGCIAMPRVTLGAEQLAHKRINLEDSLILALENDSEWNVIQKQTLANKEILAQSRAQLRPSINAYADTAKNRINYAGAPTEASNSHSATLQLTQPLIALDKWFKFKQAQKQYNQLDSQQLSKQMNLIVRVSEAYFLVLKAKRNLDFAEAENKSLEKQLEQAEQRFKVGLTAVTDMHEARAARDLSQVGLIVAENDVDIFLEQLSTLCGQSIHEIMEFSESFEAKLPLNNASWWTEYALKNSPEMKAQAFAVEGSRFAKKSAKSAHLPTISVESSYSQSTGYFNGFSQPDTDTTKIGLQLNIPIYQGGGTASVVREAQYQYLASLDQLEASRRIITQNVRNLYRSIAADKERIMARKQSIQSAQSALDATQAGYQVGTRNIVDVVSAQRTLLGAKKDYAHTRYDFVLNTLKLQEAAGLLSIKEITAVNQHLK